MSPSINEVFIAIIIIIIIFVVIVIVSIFILVTTFNVASTKDKTNSNFSGDWQPEANNLRKLIEQ